MKKVKKYVTEVKAKALFVGTDNNDMLNDFRKELDDSQVWAFCYKNNLTSLGCG